MPDDSELFRELDEQEHYTNLQKSFLFSFLIVIGGVLIANSWWAMVLLILVLFFPEATEKLSESNIGENPNLINEFPQAIFFIAPVLLATTAFSGGYFAARFAPAARLGHGLMIAGVMLLQAFQNLLGPNDLQPIWFLMLTAIIGPLSALIGALQGERAALICLEQAEDESDENSEDDPLGDTEIVEP